MQRIYRKIYDIDRLVKQYEGSKSKEWKKVKGIAELDYLGEYIKGEIHWYEEPSVGKVELKYKGKYESKSYRRK